MSELRKANTDHSYFITLTVVGWIDVFTRKEYCEITLKNLQYCQANKGLKIYAYVIMPSHVHLVARHHEGKLNEVLRDFKSFTSKAIIKDIEENGIESRKEWLIYMFRYFGKKHKQNKVYMFWQKTNYPIELFSSEVINQKIKYIENNPVAASIVDAPENYVYSSANKFYKLIILNS
jgi:putative transposase